IATALRLNSMSYVFLISPMEKIPSKVDFNALFTHCLLKGDNITLGVGFLHGGFFAALRKRKQF
ncbi:hypothetical protein M4D52_25870, partial [Paenibacillus lactis]|uniref:hypothetical protein n=1 Tax=Paenibacillus lactis TaxID=228574 RepID=UPI00203BD7DB